MGNPLSRFLELIRNPSYSRTTTLLVILTIALAIPLTVFVAQQQQETRQQAAVCPYVDIGGVWCEGNPALTDSRIALKCTETEADISCGGRKTYKCSQEICTTPPSVAPSPVAPSPVSTACKPPPTIDSINVCPAPLKANPQQDIAVCNGKVPDCSPHQLVKIQADGSLYCFDPNTLTFVSYATCPTAAVPPATGGGLCNVAPFTIGKCTQADRDKQLKDGLAIHGSCKRVCQAGTARAGQEVDGISYKECQSNFCWYDSLYDPSPAKIEEGKDPKYGPGWCYGIPGQPDPCAVTAVIPPATGTQITFNLGLSGIGNTGDSQTNFSNASGSNKNPGKKSRKFFYQVLYQGVNQVEEGEGLVAFSSGKFTSTINLGKTLPNGTYDVKARVLGYKVRLLRNFSITAQSTTVTANLPTGDIDGNLDVNTLDYDILRSCWGAGGTDAAKCNSNASFRGMSDLDDNGTINEFDYNLFLRDFAAAQKEE